MKRALRLAVLLFVPRAFAGPVGAVDAHAAPATGFPGAYLESISLAAASDPFYGSRFLDGLQVHVQAVTGMTAAPAIASYLEQSATAGQGLAELKSNLGAVPLDPPKAAALLVANALARPQQFREVLDNLETFKPGLGRHAAEILRRAKGVGDRRVIDALRAAGARQPRGQMLTYGSDGRLDLLFDGIKGVRAAAAEGSVVSVPSAYGPDGRVRPSGLLPAKR
ncbi:MAG: hypothetical protein KGL74_09280 [Elusimicrobia bacterium]|nr:hypothetical protein [Elusimicrobiota bacterium]